MKRLESLKLHNLTARHPRVPVSKGGGITGVVPLETAACELGPGTCEAKATKTHHPAAPSGVFWLESPTCVAQPHQSSSPFKSAIHTLRYACRCMDGDGGHARIQQNPPHATSGVPAAFSPNAIQSSRSQPVSCVLEPSTLVDLCVYQRLL